MKNLKLLLTALIFSASSYLLAQPLAVYVSDAGNFNSGPWQIAKFDENGNLLGALMNDNDGIVWPQDIVFLDSQNVVLISNLGAAGVVSRHDPSTGNFVSNFAEGIAGPTRTKIGADNRLYVLQWSSTDNKVLRYELDGTFVDEFTTTGVPNSIGIDWDSSGDLYVSSYSGNYIQKFDGTTGADLGPFINTGLSGPTNIFFEQSGNLVVFNYNNGIIQRYDSGGNYIEDLITGVTGCEGFDFFPNGDILIGVGSDGSVRRYDSSYNFIENFVDPGILLTPNAIVIRPDDYPLGVNDITSPNLPFVLPSFGSEFTLSAFTIQNFEILTVYDSIGKLVKTIITESEPVWNASSLAEGMYVIKGDIDGNTSTQRILIKKR